MTQGQGSHVNRASYQRLHLEPTFRLRERLLRVVEIIDSSGSQAVSSL